MGNTNLTYAQLEIPAVKIGLDATYPIGEHLYFLEDKEDLEWTGAIKKFDQKEFDKLNHSYLLNNGFSSSVWWYYFKIENTLEEANRVIFSPGGTGISLAKLYSFNSKGEFIGIDSTGYSVSPKKRKIESRINSFEISFHPKEEKTFLLRLDSRGLSSFTPFFLDSVNPFWEYEVGRSLGFGLVGGILIMASLLGVFLVGYMREKIYLYFSLFVFASLMLILEEDGFSHLFFYGNNFPMLTLIHSPFWSLASSLFFSKFMISYFDHSAKRKVIIRVHKVLQVASWIGFLLLLTNLLPHEYFRVRIGIVFFTFIIAVFNLVCTVFLIVDQIKFRKYTVYFFLLSGVILVFGFLNYFLNNLGLTSFNFFYPNGIVFGSLLMVLVLSFGVINRYYSLHSEKNKLANDLLQEEKNRLSVIFEALDQERNRIGKDLHDDLGSLLSISKLKLGAVMQGLNSDKKGLSESLYDINRLIELASQDIRFIAHELMPEDYQEKRLKTLISDILEMVRRQGSIKINYDIGELPILPNVIKLHVFRIIKELLNNILKHSRAEVAEISLFFDNEEQKLNLLIVDNGMGFDKEKVLSNHSGLGILSIQKRVKHLGGEISIDSDQSGTQVSICIPLNQPS